MRSRKYLVAVFALAVAIVGGAAYAGPLTYTKDIAPILNENCVSCHRPGQIAPMSLMSYDEVRPWAKSIRKNVSEKTMPPWHATAYVGEFVNDRSLDQSDIDTILAWIDQGTPRGSISDLPPTPEFPEGRWRLGEPDFIVELPEVEIPADGPDIFKNLPGKVMLPEDRWVTAVEILPGNAKVVHHVLTFQVKGFGVDPVGGWMGAWAAGTEPMEFPATTGRIMRKGANLIGDMHYHPCGTPEIDRTRIGLHFADSPDDIEKELINTWIINERFRIPAGAPSHEVRATHRIMQDGYIMGFAPHMHYRGKDFTYTATYPDGREETLLQVADYDFNWQTNYVLKDRLEMPKGTVIECVAHFDNSAGNPANPDPTIDITFGEESYDEMMIGFFDFIVKDGLRPESAEEARARLRTELYAAHPGEVYGLYNRDRDDASPMYLPRSGDGLMVLNINGTVTELPMREIVWTGDDFKALVPTEQIGDAVLSGSVDPKTGELKSRFIVEEREIDVPLKGFLMDRE